jgi:histone deacetylase complex subunit SAP18
MSNDYPQVLRPNTRIAFRLLYTDSNRPRILLKDVGMVALQSTPQATPAEDAGSRTLEDVKYVIGDWIDVAIFSGGQGGPPPRGGSFGRQGGMGERGRGARGDSYRGGMRGGGRMGGRNGFEGGSAGDGDERGPPGGPRRDRDRDRDRGRW